MISQEESQAIIDLFPFIGDKPTVFDVGSNKGHFSDLMLSEYGDNSSLYLFEPNKMLLDFTKIRFEYRPNVTYSQYGISDKTGKHKFFYFENYNNEISSFYEDKEGGWEGLPMKTGEVDTISIDEYCGKNKIDRIDFLKLDIEGAEYLAILGAAKMLEADKIKVIQIEYGGHYVRANSKFTDVINFVSKFGYKVYKYAVNNFFEVKDFKEDYHAENYYITKEEIHNYSMDGGWVDAFMLSVIDLPKFDLMLEVGAYEGITTKYMCQKMLNEGGRVIVVDPLMDVYIEGDTDHPYFKGQYQRFLRNTRGLPVELKRGNSEDELPKLNALRFCFCYIDGNHWHPHPYNDACWCFAETKIGGFILFDDYRWNDNTQGSIDKFLTEFSGSIEIIKKDYQVLIKKTANQYNDLTIEYYK